MKILWIILIFVTTMVTLGLSYGHLYSSNLTHQYKLGFQELVFEDISRSFCSSLDMI